MADHAQRSQEIRYGAVRGRPTAARSHRCAKRTRSADRKNWYCAAWIHAYTAKDTWGCTRQFVSAAIVVYGKILWCRFRNVKMTKMVRPLYRCAIQEKPYFRIVSPISIPPWSPLATGENCLWGSEEEHDDVRS